MKPLAIVSSILLTVLIGAACWACQELVMLHEEYRYHQMRLAKGNADANTNTFVQQLMRSVRR